MKNKLLLMMQPTKKKVGAALLGGALFITVGSGVAYAANSSDVHEFTKELIRNINGVIQYSTDDGDTWNDGYPEGVTVTEGKDGRTLVTHGEIPKDGEGNSLMVKNENGVTSYSTDNGETWSQDAPEGVTVNEDGSITRSVISGN